MKKPIIKLNSDFNLKDYFKTPFSIFVTLFYSAFSIYFIFQIPTSSTVNFILQNPLKVLWYISFLFLAWFIAYLNLKNVNLVNNNFFFSIFLTCVFFGYQLLIFFVFFQDIPKNMWTFLTFLWFIFGALLINLLWKIFFVVLEFKSQPLIAQKNIFIIIQNSIFLTYIPILIYFLNRFLASRDVFSIQDNQVIIPFIYVFVSGIVLIYSSFKVFSLREEKLFELFSNSLSFESLFNVSLIRILPITVWFLGLENIFNEFESSFDYLYVLFGFALVLVTFLLGLYFRSRKKAEGLFLLSSTTSIFISALSLFALNYFSLVNNYLSMLFYLITINFFILLNIIFKPKISLIYRLVFNSFIASSVFYLLFSSLINLAIQIEFSFLPFNLKSIVDILWLVNGGVLLVVNIISIIFDFGKISINTSKLYNQEKRQDFSKEKPILKKENYEKDN